MKNRVLIKYILGEADERERKRVERWMADDEIHCQEIECIRQQLELGTKRYRYGLFDAKEAWISMGFQVQNPFRVGLCSGIAATLLLCIGFGWWSRNERVVLATEIGEIRTVWLPDNSRVTLAGETELCYREKFGRKEREVNLSGKAYFEVKRVNKFPFIVNTSVARLKVLGTEFQVESTGESTEIWVLCGRVEFIVRNGNERVILEKGMSAAYRKGEDSLRVTRYDDVNLLAWKTGVLKFDHTPLREVVARLNAYYGAHVNVSRDWEDLELTVTFHDVNLKEALDIINRTLGIHLKP